jgi:TPR repeat protein
MTPDMSNEMEVMLKMPGVELFELCGHLQGASADGDHMLVFIPKLGVVMPVKPDQLDHVIRKAPFEANEVESAAAVPITGRETASDGVCCFCLEALPFPGSAKRMYYTCCGQLTCVDCANEWSKKEQDEERIPSCPMCRQQTPDDSVAAALMKARAEKGDPTAQFNYAGRLRHGLHGVEQNAPLAYHFLSLAAEQKMVGSMFAVGQMLMDGEGVAVDTKEGLRFITMAAEAGLPCAQCVIGENLLVAEGTRATALEWLSKAAKQDFVQAQRILGVTLGCGGSDQATSTADMRTGLFWLKRAADQGDAVSKRLYDICMDKENRGGDDGKPMYSRRVLPGELEYGLAIRHLYGGSFDIPQDESEAKRMFEKAVEQGFGERAEYQLGRLLCLDGKDMSRAEDLLLRPEVLVHHAGVYELLGIASLVKCEPADLPKAERYFRRGLEHGSLSPETMFTFGNMLLGRHGSDIVIDEKESTHLFHRAAAQKHPDSTYNLGLAFYLGTGTTRDEAKAMKCFHKAAKFGSAAAQFRLGDRYRCGIDGVKVDMQKSFKYFTAAAAQGDLASMTALGNFYTSGYGGAPVDYSEALRHFQAALAGCANAEQNEKIRDIKMHALRGTVRIDRLRTSSI